MRPRTVLSAICVLAVTLAASVAEAATPVVVEKHN